MDKDKCYRKSLTKYMTSINDSMILLSVEMDGILRVQIQFLCLRLTRLRGNNFKIRESALRGEQYFTGLASFIW